MLALDFEKRIGGIKEKIAKRRGSKLGRKGGWGYLMEKCGVNGTLRNGGEVVNMGVEELRQAKVVGQFARKFIVITYERKGDSENGPGTRKVLAIVDQHAADERIRLEKLQAASDSVLLKEPIQTYMSNSDCAILAKFANKLEKFGFVTTATEQTVRSFQVPRCLLNSEGGEVLKRRLLDVLLEFVKEIRETQGAMSSVPQTLMDIWNMQACRSAVKFNDPLSTGEMDRILRELAECQLPFQCAHGRPTVAPMLGLNELM